MAQLETLMSSLDELTSVVASLDRSELDTPSNCGPWSVRQLASHALNNQLLWAGVVTGRDTVSLEDTMTGVAIEGDLAPVATDVAESAIAMWSTPDVLNTTHATPFGELPGSVVINFPIFDALVHSWDISASVGRPIELGSDALAAISVVVDSPFADGARAAGLIAPATTPPPDATNTERLMAATGRSPRR